MMNSELKQRWLEALRSGEYKQARGRIRDGDSFCSLGVLCDVIDPTKWVDNTRPGDNGEFRGLTGLMLSRLMRMNDNEMKNFNEIADWIEVYVRA